MLFLHAHELAGRETVLRTDLNEVLSDAKVYDGNARKWIANTNLLLRDSNSIGLSLPGRERAREVLQQILDPNIETKWTLGSKSRARVGKTGLREDGNEKQAEGKAPRGRRQKGAKTQVRKLFEEDFFSRKRTSKDIQSELEKRGYKFPAGRINEALLGSTQSEHLYRTKNEANHWVFQNKKTQ